MHKLESKVNNVKLLWIRQWTYGFLKIREFLEYVRRELFAAQEWHPRSWLISMIGAAEDTVILSVGGGGGANTGWVVSNDLMTREWWIVKFWQKAADVCSWYCPGLDSSHVSPKYKARPNPFGSGTVEFCDTIQNPAHVWRKNVQIGDIECKPLTARGDGHSWYNILNSL